MSRKLHPSKEPVTEVDFISAMDRLTAMLSTVHDLAARFKDELTWIINNRDEFRVCPNRTSDISKAPTLRESIAPATPEKLACFECDVVPPASLAEALRAGWTGLIPHEGRNWEFLGLCPVCLEKSFTDPDAHEFADDKEEEPPVAKHHNGPRSLFED